MTTYTAGLLKTGKSTRSGTLNIPVWGQFSVTMELINSDTAWLTVEQGDAVWCGRVEFCREDTGIWSGELSIGRFGGWTYRIAGRKRGDALILEFDDQAKPQCDLALMAADSSLNKG